MSNPSKIGSAGLVLVKEFEGFYSRPYWDRPMPDPKAVRTIGYGTTRWKGRGILSTDRITEPEASDLLVQQINSSEYAGALTKVLNALGLELNQNEYDALLSAIYNLGAGILDKGRTLGDALRSKNWRTGVAKALPVYSEPGTSVHDGLLRRRNDEVRLFKTAVKPKQRPIKLTKTEKDEVDNLRAQRRSEERHGSWEKLDANGGGHQASAEKSKAWLRAHANAMEKDKSIKDKEYQSRKVLFLRDVALNRNGLGT
jgi:lysozyme